MSSPSHLSQGNDWSGILFDLWIPFLAPWNLDVTRHRPGRAGAIVNALTQDVVVVVVIHHVALKKQAVQIMTERILKGVMLASQSNVTWGALS